MAEKTAAAALRGTASRKNRKTKELHVYDILMMYIHTHMYVLMMWIIASSALFCDSSRAGQSAWLVELQSIK